jgi:polysaccharide export outer membrane protein
VVLLLLACPAGAQPGEGNAYRLGPRDLVSIKVFEAPELNVERPVSEEGSLSIPRIGQVDVRGLTEAELAKRVKGLLEANFLQRASVTVEVREFRARPISVIGAVKQPGNLQVAGRLSLLEALTLAGGLAENHGPTLYVLRRASNGLSDQIAIQVEDLLVKADPRVNVPIFSSDLINVTAALPVTIYCLGEVGQPGALTFSSNERITLLAAIARAGGLTDRAARKITIRRQGASPEGEEIVVDFKRILAGKAPDVALEGGDVIVVKESFF